MHDSTATCVLSYAFPSEIYCGINLWYFIIPENHIILISLIIYSLHTCSYKGNRQGVRRQLFQDILHRAIYLSLFHYIFLEKYENIYPRSVSKLHFTMYWVLDHSLSLLLLHSYTHHILTKRYIIGRTSLRCVSELYCRLFSKKIS